MVSTAAVDGARADFEQKRARLVAARTRVAAKSSTLLARDASIRIAEAEVVTARAQVKHRQAALNQVRVDLANTYIRSPVDGVVINRRVDVGQTVAASLKAPELFTIAKDLSAMQVEVDIDEADIGRIQAGLKAKFKVDAFPEREFRAGVSQIRLQPVVVQNVVTYTVVLAVNNAQGLLLPGMTANVDIVAQERDDILKVSNAALRFRPPNVKDGATARPEGRRGGAGRSERIIKSLSEQLKLDPSQQKQLRGIFADAREKVVGLRMSGASPDEMREAFQNLRREVGEAIPSVMNSDQLEAYKKIVARRSANPVRRGRVWILDEAKKVKRVDIWLATSDDNFTEVVRGELKENDRVITGIERRDNDKKGGLFGLKF